MLGAIDRDLKSPERGQTEFYQNLERIPPKAENPARAGFRNKTIIENIRFLS